LQTQKIGHSSWVALAELSVCEDAMIPMSSQISAHGKTDAVKKNTENMKASVFTYLIYLRNIKNQNWLML
jgi:hypothetical protein